MVKRQEIIIREEGSLDTVVFGAGCFWCSEAAFSQLRGVSAVTPGYAGGAKKNPTYQQVCSGTTGHAEVVKVEYDPDQVELLDLLSVYFVIHDPTTYNRQGNDVGSQYRSIILYTSVEQKNLIKQFIGKLTHQKLWPGPIVTELAPLDTFYPAEHEHLNYYATHQNEGYCQLVINPKLAKLRSTYSYLLK